MSHRLFLARLLAPAVLVGLVSACGGGGAPAGDVDKIQVTLSQFEVSVTNTSGNPLVEVVAEIEPAGPASHFVARIWRLENGERRNVTHSSFTDRDSVPFSPRTAKASRVIVTGQDIHGKPVRVEVPFKL